jgi:hypothetical protein
MHIPDDPIFKKNSISPPGLGFWNNTKLKKEN